MISARPQRRLQVAVYRRCHTSVGSSSCLLLGPCARGLLPHEATKNETGVPHNSKKNDKGHRARLVKSELLQADPVQEVGNGFRGRAWPTPSGGCNGIVQTCGI